MPLTARRLALCGVALLLALLAWPLLQEAFQALSLRLIGWQRDFHRDLTLAIQAFSATPSPAAWATLLGISFGYGVFHAAGPGHGKAVLATYLVSQGGARRRALVLSCAASLLQGAVAIGLVTVLVFGLGWLTRQAMGSVAWVEQASFAMVTLLGAWLCGRALRRLRRAPADHHAHHDGCCAGHHHVDPRQTGDWRSALATVVAIGLRPCSGAVLLLGAAALLGHFAVGMAAVLVMSLGTALTVSALALASVHARGWAERRLVRQVDGGRLLGWAALAGGLAIVALGVSLILGGATQPGGAPLLGEPPPREAPAESAPARHPF
ncbi:nickel/cobalt transporter [Halomonas ramblicola]|uniref:nickel/cobalt transporter n=1 Tax=Halomonas ramblicola TaxID=747349 RepID=UPI0025B5A443|nr:nickel/cobalt transporter [Halomonas ramblicola]MDN3521248.1 nickel/cobalt transporter [Halomonas ramblicola]